MNNKIENLYVSPLNHSGLRLALLAAFAVFQAGCSGAPDEYEQEHDAADDDFEYTETTGGLAAPGAWNPPPSVRKAGAGQYVPYNDAPPWDGGAHCGGKLLAGTKQLGDFLKATFPGRVSSYGGYACRQNTANKSKTSVHGTGRALDVFIPLDNGKADNGKGDEVANWLILHAQAIGVQYIIWDRSDWGGSRKGDKVGAYGGPHPHHDHIHLELTHDGAAKKTPWFNGGGEPAPAPVRAEGSQFLATPNQEHYFRRAPNGDLRHSFYDGVSNKIYHDTWGTDLAGEPVTFVHGGQQHAFARTKDGSLGHWFWDPGANKVLHDVWGTGLAGDPAAALIGEQQHVWAVDSGNRLQHWYWGGNELRHDTWGEGAAGRPTFMPYGGQQHVFARTTDGSLGHWFWDPGANKVLHDVWGTGIVGDPAAALIGEQQHAWAVDSGNRLQHWYWGANELRHDTWGEGAVGRPSIMLHGAAQHVFARGPSGSLEHWWWEPQGGMHHDVWGSGLSGAPTAAQLYADHEHVWATDAAGNAQHWWWEPKGGMHHDTWGQ